MILSSLRVFTKYSLKESKKFSGLSLVSIGMNQGQTLLGPDKSPELLKSHGLINLVKDIGWELKETYDFQETHYPEEQNFKLLDTLKANKCNSIGKNLKEIHELVSGIDNEKNFTLIIGGDHSISIGTISGLMSKKKDLGVIWVVCIYHNIMYYARY